MQSISRFATRIVTLAAAAGASIALASGPASAAGFWGNACQDGRACIVLAHGTGPGGAYWNIDGCKHHSIHDYYKTALAQGNAFYVNYANGKWDYVAPWTGRPLDSSTLVTSVDVLC
ncbi:hypothetical protein ABZ589_34945 [Streptomyces sp. NPDC013313]|uniref:hypothetical protein n=1 Tax=Streptomyces sp. NPDC013313 TaxID=3155603 RepID=UPI0033DF0543